MAALNQAHANNIIDASLGTAAFTATVGSIHCRLMTANGTATAAGTELATSGGYTAGTAQTMTFNAASAGPSFATNAITVNYTNMPATTIVGVELWDSTGTPVRKWFGPLSASKTTSSGDTFQIAAGALTAALS